MEPSSKPTASGRFVIRMPPDLHAALRDAAQSSRLSLNAYCVRKLAIANVGIAVDEDATALVSHADSVVGKDLLAVALYGSWVRGEAYLGSDVDALIVVRPRVPLGRQLYSAWDAEPVAWQGRAVDPHFVHPIADGEPSSLWAEVALDGVVLFERDWKLSAQLSRIRHSIAAGRIVRRFVHGQPYWTEKG